MWSRHIFRRLSIFFQPNMLNMLHRQRFFNDITVGTWYFLFNDDLSQLLTCNSLFLCRWSKNLCHHYHRTKTTFCIKNNWYSGNSLYFNASKCNLTMFNYKIISCSELVKDLRVLSNVGKNSLKSSGQMLPNYCCIWSYRCESIQTLLFVCVYFNASKSKVAAFSREKIWSEGPSCFVWHNFNEHISMKISEASKFS